MATYYIDNTGSDSAAGTSEGTAWATIAKINSRTFLAGDQILFKRGGTWNEQLNVPSSGASGNHIVFGAYGTGNKPLINGQYTRDNCIRAQGKSYITYQDIEITGARVEGLFHSAYGTSATDVLVQRLTVRDIGYIGYTVEQGIYPNGISFAASNVTVKDCQIYHCGWNGFTAGPPSNGSATNIVVENCHVYDNWHNGVDFKTGGNASYLLSNVTVRNCIISGNIGSSSNGIVVLQNVSPINGFYIYGNLIFGNEQQGISIQATGTANYMVNADFYNNTITGNAGMGVQLMNNGGTFRNNILSGNNTNGATTKELKVYWTGTFPTCNYNLYYKSGQTAIIGINNDSAITLAAFKALGHEANGLNTDPLLTGTYKLQTGSPAIDAGTNVGLAYLGSAPDMGAHEYSVQKAYISQNGKFLLRNGKLVIKN